MEIKFNKKTQKHEAIVDGVVICSGKSASYVKWYSAKKLNKTSSKKSAKPTVVKPAVEFTVSERFLFIEQFVKMIANKAIPSLILTGPGGLGKTFTVTQSLENMGLKPIDMEPTIDEEGNVTFNGDYLLIKGYSTAKALYRTLYENNGKIIVFDDADSVHKDPIGANILKGALDSNGKRVISWGAEIKGEDDLPQRFEFTGRVIFISNLTLDKFPQALLSRSLKVDLTMTVAEKIERIEYVLNLQESKVGVKEVITFIRKNAENISDLNVRSAINILTIRREIGNGWERLALYNAVN